MLSSGEDSKPLTCQSSPGEKGSFAEKLRIIIHIKIALKRNESGFIGNLRFLTQCFAK